MRILCIIPARSGSKGIPDKNIKILNNKPLLCHSIEQAQKSKYFINKQMRVIVSTDSPNYAKIAKDNGAEIPILRPVEIAGDLSTDYEFIKHMVDHLVESEKYYPDIILQLRPTQPIRKVDDIDKCLDIFIEKYEEFDSLRTVVPFEKSPIKMYKIEDNNLLPFFPFLVLEDKIMFEPFNQPRQLLPQSFLHNGYIDILKASILETGGISGNKIYPYIMNKEDTIDIDTLEDWNKCGLN
jgi:CMP-N-acetylneuraminic acid synthetase